MIRINIESGNLNSFNTNSEKTAFESNTNGNDLLFSVNNAMPDGDEVVLSQKTISPKTITPPPDDNDTIPPVSTPDTLRFFKNPKDMIVIEFYSNGKPHYVKNFYDNVITKKTEYTGDGTIVTEDEYVDGKLRKHTENYPASGEPWIIEEYNEEGKLSRYYEYAPFNVLIDYKAFPVE